MNQAYLNITIRVQSQQAMRQMAQMNAATRSLGGAGKAAAGGLAPLGGAFNNVNKIFAASSAMEKFGKNLQWTGRQLEYNFTLPLLLAGGAATKWALDNDTAMTRVRMVYGEAGATASVLKAETDALAKSFEILSNRFGVHQAEVIKIGAAWAEAGVAGRGLAEATKLTLEVMAVGAIDAEKAMTGLMAIQSAYKLNTVQLRKEIAVLAGINKTGTIEFSGLIDVVQRAGSVARASGIDIQHLGAMANLLTPAAGSASQAGNALRTMISRLSAPTKDTVEVLGAMGIAVKDFDWQASDGVKRIETLAASFAKLSTSQKNLVASVVASRWQINRFDLLMEDVNSTTGAYARALEETSDPARNAAIYAGMLTKYFSSTNIAFKVLTTQIQNAMARAILPLLPSIVALLTRVVQLTNWFANLSPEVQQMALMAFLLLAAVGPVAKYLGAISTLGGLLGKVFGFLAMATSGAASSQALLTAEVQAGNVVLAADATAAQAAAFAQMQNAGAMDGAALAGARLRQRINGVFSALWSIITLPFRAVGALMSLMWTGFVKGTELAFKALGFVSRMLYNLASVVLPVAGRAMQSMWGVIAQGMTAVWERATVIMQFLWTVFSAAIGVIGQTLVIGWEATVAVMQYLWAAGVTFMGTVGEALVPLWEAVSLAIIYLQTTIGTGFATVSEAMSTIWFALGQAVTFVWEAAMTAVGAISEGLVVLWSAVSESIIFLWAYMGRALEVITNAISIMWAAASTAMTAVWVFASSAVATVWSALVGIAATIGTAINTVWQMVSSGALAVWEFFTTAVGTLWSALPTVGGAVGAAIVWIWEGAGAASLAVWEFFTVAVPAMWAALPVAAATISDLILAAFTSWPVLVVAAVVALAVIFRKQLGGAVGWVIEQFNKLPAGIANVFRNVIRIVRSAVEAVFNMLASLNPFGGGGGPSGSQTTDRVPAAIRRAHGGTVPGNGNQDNVLALLTPGEFVINQKAAQALGPETLKRLNKYAAGGQVQPSPALNSFNQATAGGRAKIEAADTAKMRSDVLSFSPKAGPAFDALVASIKVLKTQLDAANTSYLAQEKVVKNVQTYTDALNATLDAERNKLDTLRTTQSAYKDELDAAKDTLQQLGHTDITGMRAMGDQIFSNEQAQKKLRLEIMKMEDAAGGSIDDLRSKMALLQGDIETMSGQRNDLRLAGAGSDILKTYDDQISALEQQRTATEALAKPIEDAKKQLEELGRVGEELDLQNSLTFDPQLRQIQQMVDGLHEMPFDQIVSSIQTQQGLVAGLTTKYNDATAAVTAQEAVVQNIEHARDAAQAILDKEQTKLDDIKDTYDQIAQSISDGEQALKDFAQAAAAARAAQGDTSLTQDLFAAGDGANFDIPGGTSTLGREGGVTDINAFNDEQQKALEEQMKKLGKIDLFKPFRDMWWSFVDWLKTQMQPGHMLAWWPDFWNGFQQKMVDFKDRVIGLFTDIKVDPSGIFDDLKNGDFSSVLQPLQDAWGKLSDALDKTPIGTTFHNLIDILKSFGGVVAFVFGIVKRDVVPVLQEVAGWFVKAGQQIWGEVQKWAPLFDPFVEALGHVFAVVSWFAKVAYEVLFALGAAVLGAFLIVWPVLFNIVKPVFDGIVGLIIAAMEIIRGIIEVVLGVINGDWSLVWEGILAIVEGVWDAIYAVISTAFGLVYGVIKGVIESIVNIFTWLYDVLLGHSIVPDIVNGIIGFFQMLWDAVKWIFTGIGSAIVWVWEHVIKPVWDAFKAVWDTILKPLLDVMLMVFTTIFNAIGSALQTVWNTVISPVWDLFTSVWGTVLKPAMDTLLSSFQAIWDGIGSGLQTVWDKVLSPIWDLFKTLWDNVLSKPLDAIKNGFKSVWDGIGDAIKGGVNLGIKAINFLIRGLNSLSDLIPGIDFHVTEIQEFAQGGTLPDRPMVGRFAQGGRIDPTATRVGAGFTTNMPRAIVGEGNPLYPEYVVPTDPAHRNRAMALWRALGDDLGTNGGALGSKSEAGGWGPIPSPGDIAGAVGKVGQFMRENAVKAAFAPFLALFDAAVSPVPQPVKGVLKDMKNQVYNWAKGVDDSVPHAPQAGNGNVAGHGYEAIVSWLMAHMNPDLFRVTSTVRGGDTGSYHAVGRAADFAGPVPSRDSAALLKINQAFLPIAGTLKELIYAGPGGQSFKDGIAHNYSAAVRDEHHNHVHAALANGGRFKVGRRHGGTLIRVGEGRNDEEMQVLPIKRDQMTDGTTVNFYGDLYFPNVSDGDDAESFIRNLEDLL